MVTASSPLSSPVLLDIVTKKSRIGKRETSTDRANGSKEAVKILEPHSNQYMRDDHASRLARDYCLTLWEGQRRGRGNLPSELLISQNEFSFRKIDVTKAKEQQITSLFQTKPFGVELTELL